MRLSFALLLSAVAVEISAVAVVPPPAQVAPRQPSQQHADRDTSEYEELWKRRGGGGGGGGRGGSSGGSSGGKGGSSSSSSGSSSGGSSSSGGRGSSSSSAGGRTTTGSGPAPAYGGGRYYGGGAAVPYRAGSTSPSGISPVLFGAGLGVGLGLAFWPGLWLHGAYLYPYTHPYSFYNASSKQNETKPIICGCDPTEVCGCDENGDTQYLSDIIGNGTNLNDTLVSVAVVNGTQRILINGTLPNGTTAGGGDEDAFSAAGGLQFLLENAGWWPVVATVCAMVFAV